MNNEVTIRFAERMKQLPPYLFGMINKIKMEKRWQGIDVIDLGMGNPTTQHEYKRKATRKETALARNPHPAILIHRTSPMHLASHDTPFTRQHARTDAGMTR